MAFKVKIDLTVVKQNLIFLVFAWFMSSLFLDSKNIPLMLSCQWEIDIERAIR